MYETLLAKISTTLDSVTKVRTHFSVPKTKIAKYPAVFYKPIGLDNSFETNNENLAVYRFMMLVIIGANQTTADNVFTAVLPKTVDAIISQFDADWNGGTIDGHRVTIKIDSADAWELDGNQQDGLVAYAPLTLEIKLLTSN
jgi:hypothetical protein